MASEAKSYREEDPVGGGYPRCSADLRRMAALAFSLATAADLPMVEAKHREAARRWEQMAAERERSERRAREGSAGRRHQEKQTSAPA